MKKKYTTNIDEELLKEAKIKAIQENINLNDLLERLLREYLRWFMKKEFIRIDLLIKLLILTITLFFISGISLHLFYSNI